MSENRKMALHGELSSIVNELKSEMYKNAGIKYRDKMIILKVSDMYIQGEKKKKLSVVRDEYEIIIICPLDICSHLTQDPFLI